MVGGVNENTKNRSTVVRQADAHHSGGRAFWTKISIEIHLVEAGSIEQASLFSSDRRLKKTGPSSNTCPRGLTCIAAIDDKYQQFH